MQGHELRAIHDYVDEFGRIVIPQGAIVSVIGMDAWDFRAAVIAVQSHGLFPRLVLLNKTNYEHYFENLSASPIAT
jgi:hypothetical protein